MRYLKWTKRRPNTNNGLPGRLWRHTDHPGWAFFHRRCIKSKQCDKWRISCASPDREVAGIAHTAHTWPRTCVRSLPCRAACPPCSSMNWSEGRGTRSKTGSPRARVSCPPSWQIGRRWPHSSLRTPRCRSSCRLASFQLNEILSPLCSIGTGRERLFATAAAREHREKARDATAMAAMMAAKTFDALELLSRSNHFYLPRYIMEAAKMLQANWIWESNVFKFFSYFYLRSSLIEIDSNARNAITRCKAKRAKDIIR